MYKKVRLMDGVSAQFVGVLAALWRTREEPTVGFVEVEYQYEDAVTDLYGVQLLDNTQGDADRARKEIEAIFRKLSVDEASKLASPDIMIKVGEEFFKCDCGCNVFYHPVEAPEKYRCNACELDWAGAGEWGLE